MEVLLVKMQEIITEYQEIANKTPEALDNDLKHIMDLCLKWNKAHEKCKSSQKIKINNLHDMMNENNIFDAISKLNKIDIPNDAQSIANNDGQPLKDINKVESKDKEEKNDFVDYYNQLAEKYNLKTVSFNGKQIKSNFYCISIKAKQKYTIFEYIEYLENLNNNIIVEFLEIRLGHYILKYQIQGPQPNFKSSKRFGIEKFRERFEEITISTIGENKRHVFLKDFKQKDASISDSLTSEYIGKLIVGEKDVDVIRILEFLLKDNYKKLKFKYINEFNFSLMMAMVLSGFSSYCKSKRSFIYSFEKTMIIDGFNRRCDAIYVHENVLVIIEFKSNVNKNEDPLKYINDRNYVKHVLSYLKTYEPDVMDGIDVIKQIGFEFFGKNKKHKVKITLTDDLSMPDLNENQYNEINQFIGKKRKLQQKKSNQSIY